MVKKICIFIMVSFLLGAPAPVTTPSVLPNSAYKDGTYTAVGTYRSPAGAEEMGVTLTLKDNTITDVVIEPKDMSSLHW
jgi:uncharacterized protein with FMN-binding domain